MKGWISIAGGNRGDGSVGVAAVLGYVVLYLRVGACVGFFSTVCVRVFVFIHALPSPLPLRQGS